MTTVVNINVGIAIAATCPAMWAGDSN